MEWRHSGQLSGNWEGPHQFKAVADGLAHEALTVRLNKLSPGLPIISEENPKSWQDRRPERYWLIDPIDGTASFVQGYPGFVTQVALMINNAPSLAAIYAPAHKQLYTGERANGAFLNGRPLAVRQGTAATLIDNFPEPRGAAQSVYESLHLSRYIECGSIALKICRVADGTADLFFKDVPVRDWDLAAPQLILEEAGGVLTDSQGQKIPYTRDFERPGVAVAHTAATHARLLASRSTQL